MLVVLDESGTHAGSRAIAVAGFVVSEERAPILASAWNRTLKRYALKSLHMRDFVPPHGRYSAKAPEERQELFSSLISVIHEHVAFGVGAAIELDRFMNTTYQNAFAKAPQLVDSPYQQCVTRCILQVADWARENAPSENFSYFIEKGCLGAGLVANALDSLRKDAEAQRRLRLNEVRFVSKSDFEITQCADFLAYEIYKELDRRISSSPRATRASLLALVRDDDRLCTITSNGLREHLRRGASVIEAMVNYLPPTERFKVRCYGLRSLTDEQREQVFSAIPAFQEIWRLCIASGEMGMRLDEVDPKLLPPDDPDLISRLVSETFFSNVEVIEEREQEDLEAEGPPSL